MSRHQNMDVLDNEFIDHHYPTFILENLKNLWLSKGLCDATLEAGPLKFYVHRLVLIAVIPGLNQLQICSTSKPLEVILPAIVKADALNTIVQYLYTGKLLLTPQNVPWVEQVAHLLGLVKLYPYCRQYQCYLGRKRVVTPVCELVKNPLIVLCESEKITQVHYLESAHQLACLQRQLSMLVVPPEMKILTIVKQEAFEAPVAGTPVHVSSNSELTLNHSEFTLGTFPESSSKERLHFQICYNLKRHKESVPISTNTVNPQQRPYSEIQQSSTVTAIETPRLIELMSSNQENNIASNENSTKSMDQNESKNQTHNMEPPIIEQKIKLEPVSDCELESDFEKALKYQKYLEGTLVNSFGTPVDIEKNGKEEGSLNVSKIISNIVDKCMDEEGLSYKLNGSTMQQKSKLRKLMKTWQDSKKISIPESLNLEKESPGKRCNELQALTDDVELPIKQADVPYTENNQFQGPKSSTWSSSPIQYFPCTTCNFVFPSEEELKGHSSVHLKPPEHSVVGLHNESIAAQGQFMGQKINPCHRGQTVEPNNQMSDPSQEKEDFSICCPVCMINFISKEAYNDHQNICFSTFHHQQMNDILQKNLQFPNLFTEGATSRVSFQSSRRGRIYYFVKNRQEDATIAGSPSAYGKTSVDREHINSNVQQKKKENDSGSASKDPTKPMDSLLNFRTTVTERAREVKLIPSSKISLLTSLLSKTKILKKRSPAELPQANQPNFASETLNNRKDESDNELKLKITDVWTLKDLPEDEQSPKNRKAVVDWKKTEDKCEDKTELTVPEERPKEKPDFVTMLDWKNRKAVVDWKETEDKCADKTELTVAEERPKEKPDFVTMFDVTAKGNKLFIKRKIIERDHDEDKTCHDGNVQKSKDDSQGRKKCNSESKVHENTREVQTQTKTKAKEKHGNTVVLPEQVKNRIRECISSHKRFQEKVQDSEKIVVTQTPIKKLTNIITAVAEGENAHLLKKKQDDRTGNCFPGQVLTSTENESSLSFKNNSMNGTAGNQQDHQTRRKVYEFRDRGIMKHGEIRHDTEGYRDFEGQTKMVANRNVSGSSKHLAEKSSQSSLVNIYSCKRSSLLNVGSIINNRKPSLQEKIAKVHRENVIVIPKLWKDLKEEDLNFMNSCEGVGPKLGVPLVTANFDTEVMRDQKYGEVAHRHDIAQYYSVPLKKRKQY